MTLIGIIFIAASVLASLAAAITQTALWQRKEYRVDRMLSFVFSPENEAHNNILYVVFTGFVGFGWTAFLWDNFETATVFGAFGILFGALYYIRLVMRRKLARPVQTLKALLILLGALLLMGGYIAAVTRTTEQPLLQYATLLFFAPVFVGIATAVVNVGTMYRKRQIIERAKVHRKNLKKLTVVGITGSYGKTSTKHLAMQLMRDDDRIVRATKDHRNSEVGVAMDMLEQVDETTDIYIAEMGAYTNHEIAHLARLTQPAVGVITAIGSQHAQLFGSTTAIGDTKWELITNLQRTGTAILNQDDPDIVRRAKKRKSKTIWYSTATEAFVYATNTDVRDTSIETTLHMKGSRRRVRIPLVSEAALSNTLAAASIAFALGVPARDIFVRIENLEPFARTMEPHRGVKRSTIIDDSYSASEHSVINAVEHMHHIESDDKRIALVPIIELGEEAKRVHERIGQALVASGATVYMYGNAYKQNIERGMNAAEGTGTAVWYTDAHKMKRDIGQNITRDTVILLEGRVPDIVRNSVIAS